MAVLFVGHLVDSRLSLFSQQLSLPQVKVLFHGRRAMLPAYAVETGSSLSPSAGWDLSICKGRQ